MIQKARGEELENEDPLITLFLSPFGSKSQSLTLPVEQGQIGQETRTKSGQEVRASGSGLIKKPVLEGERDSRLLLPA